MRRSAKKRVSADVSDSKRIFLIEDHALVREGLKRMLADEPDLTVCGEADNAHGVLALLQKAKPDLLLLDISLPGADGLELIKNLKFQLPRLRVMVVSMHPEEVYAERVLRAGARGYVMKQASPEHLLTAIRTVLRDELYLSPALSSHLLQSIVGTKIAVKNELDKLSDRELEIMRLMGKGFATKEIAKSLNISSKTVESHRGNMRQKLKLNSGAELLRFAISHCENAA